MSPRTGRPTNDPKSNWTGFRLSDNDIQKLDYCSKQTGMSRAEIVRKGIDLVYQQILSNVPKSGTEKDDK